jgi:hypothetical protein
MAEFSKSIFVPERFSQQVDEIAAAIRPAVREESETKLARFSKVVAGESVGRSGPDDGHDRMMGPGGQGEDEPRFGGGAFRQPAKPIKSFVTARAQSVTAQLAGNADDAVATQTGFGPPGPKSERGGPGGPRGFGPGLFVARAMMEKFDTNNDGKLTRDEFVAGFAKWFADWNTDQSGALSDEQLRAGINRDLAPFHGGPPGGPGFGPPDEP